MIPGGLGLGGHLSSVMRGVSHLWTIPPAVAAEGYLQQPPQPSSTSVLSKDNKGGGGGGGLCLLSSRRVFLGNPLLPSHIYCPPPPPSPTHHHPPLHTHIFTHCPLCIYIHPPVLFFIPCCISRWRPRFVQL